MQATSTDVDARLLYGVVLSGAGRYDEARRELNQVLMTTPDYLDARVALMRVEFAANRLDEARDVANQVLAEDAGNVPARAIIEQIDATQRPWWAAVADQIDTFSDGRDPWNETDFSLARITPVGPAIVRARLAQRFGGNDQLVEVDFYPRFSWGGYAYINVGAAPSATIFPNYRLGFDLYQAFGAGWEASGGFRRLAFEPAVNVYVGTLSKYINAWMLTGKVFHVPGSGRATTPDLVVRFASTSYHVGGRRYFGRDSTSYVGVFYAHGLTRDEFRDTGDLANVDSDSVRGEFEYLGMRDVRLLLHGALSHQQNPVNFTNYWQRSVSVELRVPF